MRKDVRTGALIGGILIAVLVVFGIVNSRNKTKKPSPVTLETSGPAGDSTSTPPDNTAQPDHPADGSSADAVQSGGVAPAPAPADAGQSSAPTAPPVAVSSSAAPSPAGGSENGAVKPGSDWATILRADRIDDVTRTRTPDPALSSNDDSEKIKFASETRVGRSAARHLNSGSDSSSSSDSASTDAPTRVSGSSRTYTVKPGETFSSIARSIYGDARYYKLIMKANPSVNPTRLRAGATINIPERSQMKSTASSSESDSPSSSRRSSKPVADPDAEYRVQSNDSLYKISMKLYHTPNRVDAIYQLNKAQIGPDPEKLKLDMVLKLPEPPARASS